MDTNPGIETFLKGLGFEEYADVMHSLGLETLENLIELDGKSLEEAMSDVKMKKFHGRKLLQVLCEKVRMFRRPIYCLIDV